jgi:hypothetical protein
MPGVGKANTATSVAATGDTLTSSDQASRSLAQVARTYPPSWVDRLTGWVEGLPGPAWLYYAGVALVLILVRAAVGWSDGSYPVGTFFPVHVLDAGSILYWLCVLHYLDKVAASALANFRAVLTVDGAGYEELRYRLTTMPALPVLAWSLVGLAFGVSFLHLMVPEQQLQSLKYFTSPAATAVDVSMHGLGWMFNAIFAYHTVQQLRLVSRIYTRHTNVNVFETDPLYALSRVSAVTAVAVLFLTYLYLVMWANWQFKTAADATVALAFVLVALATFVWPLWGAHRLLQDEKTQRKRAVARRIEALADDLHSRLDRRDLKEMDRVKDALDSLVAERGVLDKVSTWPWEPETMRVVVTALLLPVVLWIVTRILERFVGF